MRSVQKEKKVCLFLGFFLLVSLFCLKESLPAPYYEGKVIKIIVGNEPGGGYDRMGRLLAKHLPKHIPGKPTVLVENMPGAIGMILVNHMYNVVKPDGLTIATFNRGLPSAQLLKAEGVKFDLMKCSWIGSTTAEPTVLTLRSELPYKSLDDLRKAKEPIYLGCTGTGDSSTQFPVLLREFVQLNLKIVDYPSSSAAMLAVERKEVHGRAGSYSSLIPFIERGVVHPILRGRVSEPGIDNLPVDEELTTNKLGKTIMAMRSAMDKIGRPYLTSPGTPMEIMNILTDAFAKVANDPELKQDAKKNKMTVEYSRGDECLKVLKYLFSQSDDIVKEFGKLLKF